ncbi:MAG: hypothetical protein LBH19_15985 [Dysgonamonadaceae bacterium]|jgi:hypothetical protein|nr:hypothetical protein [Dysgonamonadaceae bacterium]
MKPIAVFVILFCSVWNLQAKMFPTGLTCEMMQNPVAIETQHPRFGWKLL